ncbi:MAG: DNA-binding protein [Nitrososphaeria archaeon]|nr:DNA-binding protein [Nitrosopumilaceae archaeon]NIP10443.1 DNA-binding protein [Nitrosopumilaceae archaeon]NIP90825.1 DNA-binding protein [Nitrososphaeria archaeon]NIS95086.1 DNA-binding protein [Nitrosopumilaceae archaeon]
MSFPDSDESQDNSFNEEHVNEQKEGILKQILSGEARMRLNNIKMVKPDLANLVEQYLIGMASQGKIRSPLTDDQLKQILLSIQQPKRDFKFNRV